MGEFPSCNPNWPQVIIFIYIEGHIFDTRFSLTLHLMAVGGSAHTFFKGLLLEKSLSAKNRQKIPIPRSAESKSRVMYP
jgi:hypothetical protein